MNVVIMISYIFFGIMIFVPVIEVPKWWARDFCRKNIPEICR